MELKAEYRRETYRNYVLLDNGEDNIADNKREELYEIPMILNNKVPYLLNVQITYLNEKARYAYDITSTQAMADWVDRRKIKRKDCEHLYSSLFGAIDACCEYLLDEKNLVFLPKYIYYDLGKNSYRFIYHVHYYRDILQQINDLSEFLMDHIDYEDERAVLLVYAMYHESKRKESSIDTLITVFHERKSKENQIINKDQKLEENQKFNTNQVSEVCDTIYESKRNITHNFNEENNIYQENNVYKENNAYKESNKIKKEVKQEEKIRGYEISEKENIVKPSRKQLVKRPIMESRQESERLVSKYPVQSYSVVGVTLLVMLIVLAYSISQGLEPKKLIAVILIVASITAYIGSKMFDPKKKVEKMLPIIEYVKEPEANIMNQSEDRIMIDNNKQFDTKQRKDIREKKDINEAQIEDTKVWEGKDNKDLIYGNTNVYYNDSSDNEGFTAGEAELYECTQLLSIVAECSDIDDLDNNNQTITNTLCTQYVLLPEDVKYKRLEILDFPFYIGKITDGMDAVIMESTISRVHAKITKVDESFYITDMGSTNGTYINEENIQPHSRIEIKIGDILRFANVAYIFSNA